MPSPPTSWITSSRHVSFSFLCVCVYFSYFFFLPFLFGPPSLFCHVIGGCVQVRKQLDCQAAFLPDVPSASLPPSLLSPPPPFSPWSADALWKLEKPKLKRERVSSSCPSAFNPVTCMPCLCCLHCGPRALLPGAGRHPLPFLCGIARALPQTGSQAPGSGRTQAQGGGPESHGAPWPG